MSKKKPPASPGKKTDYAVPPDVFVSAWEKGANIHEVFNTLKTYSEKHGNPVMPVPIIAARAAEYRRSRVPLKKMPRVSSRNLDAQALTELVEKVRAGAPAPQTLAPKAVPAKPASGRGLTREEVEEVVVGLLRKYGLVK